VGIERFEGAGSKFQNSELSILRRPLRMVLPVVISRGQVMFLQAAKVIPERNEGWR